MSGADHVLGIIITIVGALLGAAVGWGSMRAGLSDLKDSVGELKGVSSDVSVLKADSPKVWAVLDDHGKRIGKLEVNVASLPLRAMKVAKPRRRKY